MKIFDFISAKLAKQPDTKSKNLYTSDRLVRTTIPRIDLEMDRYKAALYMAKNVLNPDRRLLYTFYDEFCRDAHLQSQLRTAKFMVAQSKFVVTDKNNNPKEELHNLFENTWFIKFIEMICDAEFWGHSLIEFHFTDSFVSDVLLIDRMHVKPELGFIAFEPGNDKGLTYRDELYRLNLLETQNFFSLGLFENIAREVIWKNYARSDWSRASEKYGMPLLAVKTNTSNPRETDKMEDMAQNFGANGYVIIDRMDDVSINTMSANGEFFKSYLELSNLCDSNISKLINGQTMTSDDGSSYSQANVHERILNNYTRARIHYIQNFINDNLFPFLIQKGYPLTDTKFLFQDIIDWYADKPETTIPPDTLRKKKTLNFLYR